LARAYRLENTFGTQDLPNSSYLFLGVVEFSSQCHQFLLEVGELSPHVISKTLEVAKLSDPPKSESIPSGRKEARSGDQDKCAA
jgi:hypothetical protein